MSGQTDVVDKVYCHTASLVGVFHNHKLSTTYVVGVVTTVTEVHTDDVGLLTDVLNIGEWL